MKLYGPRLGGWLMILCLVSPVWAGKIVRFLVSPATISFPQQDPDLVPEIPALSALNLDIHANQMGVNEPWSIDIMAADDLVSGSDRIPIEAVSWQTAGTISSADYSLHDGRLSRGVYVPVASGNGAIPNKVLRGSLTLQFYLRNRWDYASGDYTQRVTLRMTVQGEVQFAEFTLSYSPQSLVKLELSAASIAFPDANPDLLPLIPAHENPLPVIVKACVPVAQLVFLRFRAAGDLVAGGDVIPIGQVDWLASGNGFVSGVMNRAISQVAGNWTGSGERSGSFEFRLRNSWIYNVGSYSGDVVVTVSTI